MAKITFTPQELETLFSGNFKSEVIDFAKKLEASIRVHSDGIFPQDIIERARPNESKEVLEYRKCIWKPKTKATFNRVFTSLQKIRRSADWMIRFPQDDIPANIPEDETLEEYITKQYPALTHFERFVFESWLREYLVDPNSVYVVLPGAAKTDTSDFTEPYVEIFNSSHVVYHKPDDFCVLVRKNVVSFTEKMNTYYGDAYLIVTTDAYLYYQQTDLSRNFVLVSEVKHGLGFLPAWKSGGILLKKSGNELIYESRLSGMLPELDEAVREYSDLQAGVVMNIFPERWEIATTECSHCSGTGKVTNKSDDGGIGFATCGHCKGIGYSAVTPYSKLLVKPPQAGEQAITPPVGYVSKPVEIIELQDKRVEAHIYNALSSINMQFLAAVPMAESGVAKEVDRDETNNFVNAIAEDLVYMMENSIRAIAHLRYSTQNTKDAIDAMLPVIPIPQHYDLFSLKYDEAELKSAKEMKLNPVIISSMEIDYAAKKFYSEPDVYQKLELVLEHDPLANISEDDKILRLNNNGVSQLDYIISSNINQFVDRSLREHPNFPGYDYARQREIIVAYAKAELSNSSVKVEIFNGE